MASRTWSMPTTVMPSLLRLAVTLSDGGACGQPLSRRPITICTIRANRSRDADAFDVRAAVDHRDRQPGLRPGGLSDAPGHPDRTLRGGRLDRSGRPRPVGRTESEVQP